MNGLIETLNVLAAAWSGYMLQTLVESSLLLGMICGVWFFIRKRASVQFGYALFLLVLVKPLVPMQYSIPLPVDQAAIKQTAPITNLEIAANPTDNDPMLAAETASKQKAQYSPITVNPSSEPKMESRENQALGSMMPKVVKSPALLKPLLSMSVNPYLFLLWLGIVLMLLVVFLWKYLSLCLLIQNSTAVDPSFYGIDWKAVQQKAGVKKHIPLLTRDAVKSPLVFGMLKPRILLPKGFFASMSIEQQRWILLHELAHIRRGDFYVACFQRLMQIVFFFHPAIWLANYFVDRLREYACDDFAYALSDAPRKACGEGLLKIVEQCQHVPAGTLSGMGLLGRSSFVRKRMVRLLDQTRKVHARLSLTAKISLAIFALVALPSLHFYAAPINAAEEDTESLALTFDGSVTLNGTVISQKTHNPVSGAVVKLVPTDREIEHGFPLHSINAAAQTTSNKNGEFQFEGVPEDEYMVLCYADEYIPYRPRSFGVIDPLTRVPVDAAHDGQSISIKLEPGHAIDVQVLTPSGDPVEGATVVPVISEMRAQAQPKTTDSEGRCTFNTLARKTGKIFVKHEDWGWQASDNFVPGPPNNPTSVTMQLQPTGTITGNIKLKDGTPGENITVYMPYSSTYSGLIDVNTDNTFEAVTDEHGRYTFTNLGPGRYSVQLNNNEKSQEWYDADYKRVDLAPGKTLTNVDFEAQKFNANFEYTLKVVGPNGEPIPHARFTLHYNNFTQEGYRSYPAGMTNDIGKTNEEGEHHFTKPIRADSIDIGIKADGYFESIDKLPLSEQVVVQMEAAGKVKGRVVDAAGNPIAGALVYVDGGPHFQYDNHGSVTSTNDSPHNITDNQGRFEIGSLYPAVMQVIAGAQGYLKSEAETVQIERGKPVDGITLTLQRGTSVKGVVQDSQGNPLAGAQIGLRANAKIHNPDLIGFFEETTLKDTVLSDQNGTFEIYNVQEGATLCIWHDDFAPTEVNVTPDMLEGASPLVTLHEGGTLVGNVYEDGGGPLVGARVKVFNWPENLYTYEAIIGEDGTYRIDHLPEEEFFVRKSHSNETDANNHEQLLVTIEKGKTIRADFGRGPGAIVQGTVYENGKPLTKGRVALADNLQNFHKNNYLITNTNENGEYILQAVTPGEWYLFFQKIGNFPDLFTDPNYAEAIKKVEISYQQSRYTIDLHGKPYELKLHVLNADTGNSIEGVNVKIDTERFDFPYNYHLRGRSDNNGDITLQPKLAHTYPLVFTKPGYLPQKADIEVPPLPEGESELLIEKQVKLQPSESNTVLDLHLAYNNQPFETDELNVRIKKDGIEYPVQINYAASKKLGHYRIEGCPSGDVTLMIYYLDDEKLLFFPEKTLTFHAGETYTFMTELINVRPYQLILESQNKRLEDGFARAEFPTFPEFNLMFRQIPIASNGISLIIPQGDHVLKIYVDGYQPVEFNTGELPGPSQSITAAIRVDVPLTKR